MAARNATINLAANTWTQLTDGNVTVLRLENQSAHVVHVLATNGEVEPTSTSGSVWVTPSERDIYVLSSVWPGVAGANRVYAFSAQGASMSVSHA